MATALTSSLDLYDFFDRVYVINLERRHDRWQRFLQSLPPDWPFGPPFRFAGIDGLAETPPEYWQDNRGAWGCYRSHMAVLEDALARGYERVLVLEDDAVCCRGFADRVRQFLGMLPADWRLVFFGGQHIQLHLGRPRPVNSVVYRPFNVNRMHAYAYRGKQTMKEIRTFLTNRENWPAIHHVDHILGEYQKRNPDGIYVPANWLIAQDGGESDIVGQALRFRPFVSAAEIDEAKLWLPLVAVIGPFSSGTSALSGALHHLGISMGRNFERPDRTNYTGHFEAAGLAKLCRHMFQEPWMIEQLPSADRRELLRIWASGHTRTFQQQCALVGGKHPSFCLMGADLETAWDRPRLLVVDRDEEHIINSLAKRGWGWPLDTCTTVIRQMLIGREEFLRSTRCSFLRVEFDRLRREPRRVLAEITGFLDFVPTPECFVRAVQFIRSS